ncbi:MAG: HMA2 domain-containing protein, partial [Desulfovibrionaceae bacterium]
MTRRPRVEGLRIAHRTPGRVRIQGARLRNPALDCDYLRAFIEAMDGVQSARMNACAGSVAIEHDDSVAPEDLLAALSRLPRDAYAPDAGREPA